MRRTWADLPAEIRVQIVRYLVDHLLMKNWYTGGSGPNARRKALCNLLEVNQRFTQDVGSAISSIMKALNTSLARNQTLKAKIEAQVLAHRHSYAYSPFGKWSIILGSRLLSLQWDTECKKKALVDLEAVLSQSGQGSTYKGAKPIETTELIVDSDPVG